MHLFYPMLSRCVQTILLIDVRGLAINGLTDVVAMQRTFVGEALPY